MATQTFAGDIIALFVPSFSLSRVTLLMGGEQ